MGSGFLQNVRILLPLPKPGAVEVPGFSCVFKGLRVVQAHSNFAIIVSIFDYFQIKMLTKMLTKNSREHNAPGFVIRPSAYRGS